VRGRGVGEDPDRVLRSPLRYLGQAGVALGVPLAAYLAVSGSFHPLALLAGSIFLVAGVAGVVLFSAPSYRRPLPPARAVEGGIELPTRPGHRAAVVATELVLLVMAVFVAVTDDSAFRLVCVALAAFAVLLLVTALRRSPALRLDPDGLTTPHGLGRPTTLTWPEVTEVRVRGTAMPFLVAGTAARPATARKPGALLGPVLGQAWPPSVLVAVLDHYRRGEHADDRAGLTDPTVLDRFR
jgi:hypothetical protein